MNSCLRNNLAEMRRCRPLLGTFVEVAVWQDDHALAVAAIDAAFKSIERVQRLMSFHDPESEISELNRLAAFQAVRVSSETYRVLRCAKELHERTKGLFDITVAHELVKRGLLPRHKFLGKSDYRARASDIMLLPNRCVWFQKPLTIDLGGIAKGFAVDQAVETLQEMGVTACLVNAGGDMRCFGELEQPVWVRNPRMLDRVLPLTELKNAALATSSDFCVRGLHIDGRTRQPMTRSFSVSVCAASCLLADALTKVVMVLGRRSVSLLSEMKAEAFIVYPDNQIICFKGRAA